MNLLASAMAGRECLQCESREGRLDMLKGLSLSCHRIRLRPVADLVGSRYDSPVHDKENGS